MENQKCWRWNALIKLSKVFWLRRCQFHIISSIFKPCYFHLEFQNLERQLPTELTVQIIRLLRKLAVQQTHILLQSAKAALKWAAYFNSALAWNLQDQEIEMISTLEFISNQSILRHILYLLSRKKYHLLKRDVFF